MQVTLENVNKDTISCNFCSRGSLNEYQAGLIYPYENVLTFTKGNGLKAAICKDCLEELYQKGKFLLPTLK